MHIRQPNQTEVNAAVIKLKKRAPKLAEVIARIGPCRLECREQGLAALVYSVIGQQLSNSSARAIRSRFDSLFENDGIEPRRLAGTSEEELRKTGLSLAKGRCLRSLAQHVLSGKINFLKLEAIDDEAVISTLTQVKGIGRWTAEMYLMFSLGRLDVFPIDDLAIRTAMSRIYGLPETGFLALARQTAEQWRPYRTIACWYLYRYLDMLRGRGKQA
ncbi:DNA-3-methyladenine glycosylase [Candidatus Bathyarchaeota archaeon]|jgi:DNA-3-methyladenine glycosylase II|nr:DNA-3-methyladenine glycosylase [Candidatus Bathyarchaeota archaeon]